MAMRHRVLLLVGARQQGTGRLSYIPPRMLALLVARSRIRI
ncbi:hypothetical protein RSPO_c03156 [Ralstonia solanacearum Po82]|uniref:Uncharacterized protein n=1 Tax=Ralstonia solanacearum (strain Po82) TaxID=1031711 RepID=F6G4I3_RALS8|nr:hypothetical protein RSPO_c03156 [Ralstonia solanacearum Po82]